MLAPMRSFVLAHCFWLASSAAAQQPAKAPVKPRAPHAEYQMHIIDCVTVVSRGNDSWVVAEGRVKGIKDKHVRCWRIGKEEPVIIPGPRGTYYSRVAPATTPGQFVATTYTSFRIDQQTEGGQAVCDFWDIDSRKKDRQIRLLGSPLFDMTPDLKYAAVSSAYAYRANDEPPFTNKQPKGEEFDKTSVTIYEVASGKALMQLKGHKGMVRLAKISPDGDTIATADRYEPGRFEVLHCRRINLWSLKAQKKIAEISTDLQELHTLAFSPDGKYLLTQHLGAFIKLWDVAKGEPSAREYRAGSFAFSPDGKTLALGGVFDEDAASGPLRKKGTETAIIKLLDFASGKETASWVALHRGVKHLCFSPDGKFLMTADHYNNIKVWKLP